MSSRHNTDSTPFVVLTTQRSGSVLLVQALRSHSDVECYHEMFKRSHRHERSLNSYLEQSRARRSARYLLPYQTSAAYLEELFSSQPQARAVGFKLMYNQLRRHPELWLLFKRREILVVHLIRANVLHTEVSAIRSRETGLFHTREQGETKVLIDVPTQDLVKRLERRERSIRRHQRLLHGFSSLELSFESLVDDREQASDRLCDFLGVERRMLVTTWKKVAPADLADVVGNYGEVEQCLRDTRFGRLLDARPST